MEFPDISKAFFPVEKQPLYWTSNPLPKDEPKEYDLSYYEYPFGHLTFDKDHAAIVDMERRHVFTCSNMSYALITNEEAYIWGREIANLFFLDTHDFVCYRLFLTRYRAVCEMDICRKIELNQPMINGGWCSFIRIMNSYDQSQVLSYEVGFYNVLKQYGIIFPDLSIKISERHSGSIKKIKSKIISKVRNRTSWRSQQIEMDFINKMIKLHKIRMTDIEMFALFCKIFKIKQSSNLTSGQEDTLKKQLAFIQYSIQKRCHKDQGNGEDFVNVIADYIAHFDDKKMKEHLNHYQIELGKWVDEFLKVAEKGQEAVLNYMNEYLATAFWFVKIGKS